MTKSGQRTVCIVQMKWFRRLKWWSKIWSNYDQATRYWFLLWLHRVHHFQSKTHLQCLDKWSLHYWNKLRVWEHVILQWCWESSVAHTQVMFHLKNVILSVNQLAQSLFTCFSMPSRRLRSLWKSLKASFTKPSRFTLSVNSSSGFLSSTMDTTISNCSHSGDRTGRSHTNRNNAWFRTNCSVWTEIMWLMNK